MKLTKNFIQPIAGAMLCIFLFSCGGKNAQNGSGMVREYAVMTLQPDSMEWYSNYPAAIKGKRDIEIRPNVSGFITDLRVDEGSVVRKGQVLFVIDTVPYKAALKVAETNVEVAKASTETARLTAENKRELQRRDIISEYDLQMAENSYASAKAQLAQAEAQLVNARNNDSYTPCFNLGQHTLKAGTVIVRAGVAIIHKEYRVREVVLFGVFQKDGLLVLNGQAFAEPCVLLRQSAVKCGDFIRCSRHCCVLLTLWSNCQYRIGYRVKYSRIGRSCHSSAPSSSNFCWAFLATMRSSFFKKDSLPS